MFTVRAQDIMSGGAIAGFAAMYFKIRDIDDTMRQLQFHLIAYSISFFEIRLFFSARFYKRTEYSADLFCSTQQYRSAGRNPQKDSN